jgi:hypothetical protein
MKVHIVSTEGQFESFGRLIKVDKLLMIWIGSIVDSLDPTGKDIMLSPHINAILKQKPSKGKEDKYGPPGRLKRT